MNVWLGFPSTDRFSSFFLSVSLIWPSQQCFSVQFLSPNPKIAYDSAEFEYVQHLALSRLTNTSTRTCARHNVSAPDISQTDRPGHDRARARSQRPRRAKSKKAMPTRRRRGPPAKGLVLCVVSAQSRSQRKETRQ